MPSPWLAVLLSALAGAAIVRVLAGATSWARARKARAALGEALDRVPEGAGKVTLRGRLEVAESLARRFEDGGEAAAATAVAIRGPHEPRAEAHARAATLTLHIGRASVRLVGPVRVVAGSREASGSRLARAGAGVRERLDQADADVAWGLRHASSKLRFLSLAHGDRVRVAGVLRRDGGAAQTTATGYREAGAPWCLVPAEASRDDAPALVAAFEGAPGGPSIRRATVGGAVFAALVSTIPVLARPPDPLEPQWEEPRAAARTASPAPPARDASFDAAERALEGGDFRLASQVMDEAGFELRAAAVHAIAGNFARAARAVERWGASAPAGSEVAACLSSALQARLSEEDFGPNRDRLSEQLARAAPRNGVVCQVLFADLLGVRDRGAMLDALPYQHVFPVRTLFDLEAGRAPREMTVESLAATYETALLHRFHRSFSVGDLLAVHEARAMDSAPRADVTPAHREAVAGRAASMLSAVGAHDAARRAWRLASNDPARHTEPLRALRVAIELRAGDLAEARRFAARLPANDEMAAIVRLLVSGPRDHVVVHEHQHASFLQNLLMLVETPSILADDLLRPSSTFDGEMLFLAASRLPAGHESILDWTRNGKPGRRRHDGAPRLSSSSTIDFLARLEERRAIAAALGDSSLAAELAASLQRARVELLRRDVAVLLYVLEALPSLR